MFLQISFTISDQGFVQNMSNRARPVLCSFLIGWTETASLIDEEDPSAGQHGQGVGHFADSGIVDESSQE